MATEELDFEQELIEHLQVLGGTKQWQYLPNIKTTNQLWDNFKQILERNNAKVLDQPLSREEFNQVKKRIEDLKTPYEAGTFLYGFNGICQIDIDLDNGQHVFLTVFDADQVGGGNTVYQVVNQIERPAIIAGRKERRFDTTLLINGLPIIQIEEKANSHRSEEALVQMQNYIMEGQFSDIFSTVQILVGMTPSDIRYMANTTEKFFNTDLAFRWQREKGNTRVNDWREFTNLFLSIPMAHQMATNYMILDGTPNKNMIKVMRPYQVYATKRVIEAVQNHHFGIDDPKLGYVWHTTGSGKTISSFKAAWLAARLPNVDKVVFMVDRIALTDQTARQYASYDPDAGDSNKGGVVSDTTSVRDLKKKLKAKTKSSIIVTSTQKMAGLVKQESFKDIDQNILFIVDEAHRSTAGEGFDLIQRAFKSAAWIGYTGTPMFDEKPSTHDIFGPVLHTYTIRTAIADHNVLGFDVDFETTLSDEVLKDQYLPKYFANLHPSWDQKKIQDKIANLTPEDMDETVGSTVYDFNENHVSLVVADILKHWRNRSVDYRYNALLTTKVGGLQASIPMAMDYYHEFKKQNIADNPDLERPLKIGISFSYNTSNSDDMIDNNEGLREAMADYSAMFGGHFDDNNVDEYASDLASRLNRTASDGQYLDLVIVIDRLLTGFDAPQMNTLYVDRTLKGALLIQAYSRTNRMENSETKSFGQIVNYRWPQLSRQKMNEALQLYANDANADVQTDLDIDEQLQKDEILAPNFVDVMADAREAIQGLRDMSQDFTDIPDGENDQESMYEQIRVYNKLINQLKQNPEYNYDEPEELLKDLGMSVEQEQRLTGGLANQLRERIAETRQVDYQDLDLSMSHIAEVKVNYDYLAELIAQLANQVHDQDQEGADATYADIQRQVKQVDDHKYAGQIDRLSTDLHNGEYRAEDYPVRVDQVEDMLSANDVRTRLAEIRAFLNKWGLDFTSTAVDEMIRGHVKGADDLNVDGSLSTLQDKGSEDYPHMAEDPEIRALKKVRYRNELAEAFTKLADRIVTEY
ncbi:HsdR family type I site-specific deoxyribonuclease [Lactobacillaceae bacterium L1_55_11]|nr:HsdR family type I site-specific deoxyribonuclease [Lactobacillaceae bacterium L1_55_11]